MAEVSTSETAADPSAFIAAVEPAAKRADAEILDALFQRVTGQAPRMWGPSIIGYGSYDYRYDSGQSGSACRVGFSPRKAKHSLYLLGGGSAEQNARFDTLLAQLGKHSRGAGCLYVNKLADIDLAVLEELVAAAWATPRHGEV